MISYLSVGPRLVRRIRGTVVRLLIIAAGGECGKELRVERGLRVQHGFHEGWSLGRNVYLGRNATIDCPRGGRLVFSDNVSVTEGLFLSAALEVKIGANTIIGEYCSIRDANHDFSQLDIPIGSQPMIAAVTEVGPDCWIGRGSVVLSGKTIGRGSVVGANSVVSTSMPELSISYGVAAKQRGTRSTP